MINSEQLQQDIEEQADFLQQLRRAFARHSRRIDKMKDELDKLDANS